MMKYLKKLNSAGDTIVEVMIVLAVLGLAISISYATANQGLQKARNAEEHSEALGIINSQVELLRSAFAQQAGNALTNPSLGPFCMAPPTATAPVNVIQVPTTGPNAFNENIQSDPLGTTRPCTQTLYNVSIKNRSGTTSGLFDIRVRWNGLGKLGFQQEELTYRISESSFIAANFSDAPVVTTCWNGTTVVSPATCPPQPVTVTCLPSGQILVPPCPPDTFIWTIIGKQYSSCVHDPTDPLLNDGNDGCNPSAQATPSNTNAIFARRGVDITYKFSSGTLTGFMGYGPATLAINFNQYAGGDTIPPDNYSFKVTVKIDGATVNTVDLTPTGPFRFVRNRRGGHSSASWTAITQSFPINIPANSPVNLELDWTNNNINPPVGRDPDLQINDIKLSRP